MICVRLSFATVFIEFLKCCPLLQLFFIIVDPLRSRRFTPEILIQPSVESQAMYHFQC